MQSSTRNDACNLEHAGFTERDSNGAIRELLLRRNLKKLTNLKIHAIQRTKNVSV
jgi:hypothetical protein